MHTEIIDRFANAIAGANDQNANRFTRRCARQRDGGMVIHNQKGLPKPGWRFKGSPKIKANPRMKRKWVGFEWLCYHSAQSLPAGLISACGLAVWECVEHFQAVPQFLGHPDVTCHSSNLLKFTSLPVSLADSFAIFNRGFERFISDRRMEK